jgi:hypothetical protein
LSNSLRIIVSGLIAQYPLGGVTWDYIQYVAGLARLGHDVYYLEDTWQWPYNPEEKGISPRCDYNVRYLARVMERFGLADRWAYRGYYGEGPEAAYQAEWFGLPDERREEIFRTADLLINVSLSLVRLAEYPRFPRMVWVDTDPVFMQIKLLEDAKDCRRLVRMHDLHFSYGECLPGTLPDTGHRWLPMRKPILLSEWRTAQPPREAFTTVMNWTSFNELRYQGVSYGQKDDEFVRFLDLPARVTSATLELAVGAGKTRKAPRELLEQKGWRVVEAEKVCPDVESYRRYIVSSLAEWTVAKNGYVRGQAGWFSGRTACYLAAGRPVVVQDTGFAPVIPVGEGVLTFQTAEEAAEGIRAVARDYKKHSAAARRIAEEYFDSDKVLSRLVEVSMNGAY